MDTNEVITNVILGKHDDGLDRILVAINNRRKLVDSAKIFTFEIGDKVKFNQTVRPKYLVGAVATIKKINRSKVVIDLDQQTGKFFRNINTPTSMIEKVESV